MGRSLLFYDNYFLICSIVVGIGMIGIGATVHYKVLLYYLKRPKAFLLGVVLQLTILPRKSLQIFEKFKI